MRQRDAFGEQLRIHRVTLTLRKHVPQDGNHTRALGAVRFDVVFVEVDLDDLFVGDALNKFEERK